MSGVTVNLRDAEVALAAATATIVIAAGVVNTSAMVFNKDAALDIFVTDDGSAPSASNGFTVAAGKGYEWPTNSLPQAAVRVFSTGTPRVFSRWS